MKRFLILLSLLFCNTVLADTINLHWLNEDGTVYENSTCVIDSDLILPSTPPTKYGYTFTGWKFASYRPIEYLESTGTQWIDTGFQYNSEFASLPFKIDFIIAFTEDDICNGCCRYFSGERGYNNYRRIMATAQCNINGTIFSGFQQTGSFTGGISTVFRLNCPLTINSPTHITIETNPNTMSFEYAVSDCGSFSDVLSSNPSDNNNIYIFKFPTAAEDAIAPIKLYRWTYESNGVKIRDFIPVLDYNGVPCLLDKVEGKFYYNQGTGQFVAGPVLTE